MKKLVISMLLLFALAAPPAMATTYDLSTSTATTGATTVPNGGVSTFLLNGTAGSYDLYPQLNREYAYGFELTGVSASQVQKAAGGDWSGVTLSVFMKFKSESDNSSWDSAGRSYLIKDMPVNSGASPYIVWIKAPPADRARVYVETSGVTAFDLVKGKLIGSQIPLDGQQTVVVIAEGYFDMPAGGTGVSTFATEVVTNLNGVGYGEFNVSGSSVYTTSDGRTTPAMSGIGKYTAALGEFNLSGNEVRNLKLAPAITARRVTYRLLSAKP